MNISTTLNTRKILFAILLLICINNVFSQGIIQGKVTSSETGEELIGATVLLKGTTTGSMVDIDGNYRIPNVAAGQYKVICAYISFRSDTIDVIVKDGETVTHTFNVGSSSMDIDVLVIEAKADRKN